MARKPRVALRVIDAERKRNIRLQKERLRLFPASLIGLTVFCVLLIIFFILEMKGWISTGGVAGSARADSVHTLIVMGFIPLVTASVILFVAKPPIQLVMGSTHNRWSYFFAPVVGFLTAMAVWCLRELLISWVEQAAQYMALPSYICTGQLLIGRSYVTTFLALLTNIFVPATALELLLRGLVQPGLLVGASPLLASFEIAILVALAQFDMSGFVLIAIGSLIASWVRHSCDSLIASSLTSAGYSFSLLMSGKVFGIAGSTLFSSITMDDAQYRVFLITCLLFMSLLLIAPIAFIQGLSVRTKQQGLLEGRVVYTSERRGIRRFTTVILTLILAVVLVVCSLFFST